MTRTRRLAPGLASGLTVTRLCVFVVGTAITLPLAAQQPPPSSAPSPAQTNPLPTTTAPNPPADPNRSAAPAPEQAIVPPPAGQAATGGTSARPPLVAKPAEPGEVDEVTLPSKPAAIFSGKAKWDDGVNTLRQTFAKMEADLGKAGIKPAGRPLAVFVRTDDDGFEFEAMIPIPATPEPPASLGDGMRFGTTPSGKALRFAHRGSYESIDGTYETLTAYLDAKDIVVQDRFVEEYVTDLKDGTDENLDVNIYALLK